MKILDHVLLQNASLLTAKARLEALGFTVAENARHPFGTENACVYFPDGTYLEPLAVYDRDALSGAARKGNTFAKQYLYYMDQFGDEGFSAIALKSDDATKDHAEFLKAGYSAGQMLAFSRPLKQTDGEEAVASFKLALSANRQEPAFHVFSCQRINVPVLGNDKLIVHPNGTTGIGRIILSAGGDGASQDYLRSLFGAPVSETGTDTTYALKGAKLQVMSAEKLEAEFGPFQKPQSAGLSAIAVAFGVASVKKAASLLEAREVTHSVIKDRIVVPAEDGQGAIFIFEEYPA